MSSIKYNSVYINDFYSIAGPLEKVGKIKTYDMTFEDYYFGEKTFEKAEVKMQKVAVDKLNGKDVNLVIGGDLSNQIANTTYALKKSNIPYLGIYSACATFCESIIIGANMLKDINNIICITSSHNLTAERQFRYPIEYGSPKKETSTFTATGCVGVKLANNGKIKIESATIGKIVDLNWKDPNHFGAAMAPAAADTIVTHLNELKRDINYYDLVLTGDLGKYGSKILIEYLKEKYNICLNNHMDAGGEIFCTSQNVGAGSSGPATIPLVFLNKIVKTTNYKKILLVATGALHSPLMLNQKDSIPAIAHAIGVEVIR